MEQKNLYLLDNNKTTIGILSNRMPFSLPFFDDLQQRSLDELTDTLTLTIPGDHPESAKVTADKYILYPTHSEGYRLYKIKEVTEKDSGQYTKEIYAEISAQDDLLRDVVRPVDFKSATLEQVMESILIGSSWVVGSVDDFGLKDYTIDDYPNKLQALVDAVKAYGGEIQFEYLMKGTTVFTQQVSVFEELGQRTGKMFTYGKDVKGIERIEDTTKLFTAIIPVGKADSNGQRLTITDYPYPPPSGYEKPSGADWLGSVGAAEQYGINGDHILMVSKDDNAQSVYELFDNALVTLKKYEKPLMTYKIDVILLEKLADYGYMSVTIGDTILVQDTSVSPPLYVQARIRKLSRSITNPLNDGVELGDYIPIVPSINKSITSLQSTINANEEKWNAKEDGIIKSPTEPETKTLNQLWLDTTNNTMKKFNGTTWEKVTRSDLSEVTGQVTTPQIANGAVKTEHISPNAVTSTEIASDAVTTTAIAPNAVTDTEIADNAVQEKHLSPNSVTSVQLVDASVEGSKIAELAVDAINLRDNAITSTKIAPNAVTAVAIADSAIEGQKIKDGAVDALKLKDSAVTSAKLAPNSIKETHIDAGAISEAKMNWSTHLIF